MRALLIATRNAGKVIEFEHALQGYPLELRGVSDVPALEGFEPDETGATFEENAVLKARAYGDKAGMLTLAEDSGLEVDALAGEPGVRTARYAEGSDADRYNKLLTALREVPDGSRGARFVAVVAIYDPLSGKVSTCEGVARGHIVREPTGTSGFGYDPVFFYEDAGKTGGLLSAEEKNKYSHRGKVMEKAKQVLQEFV